LSLDLADYENNARDVTKAFWGDREAARRKQIEAGKNLRSFMAGLAGHVAGVAACLRMAVPPLKNHPRVRGERENRMT